MFGSRDTHNAHGTSTRGGTHSVSKVVALGFALAMFGFSLASCGSSSSKNSSSSVTSVSETTSTAAKSTSTTVVKDSNWEIAPVLSSGPCEGDEAQGEEPPTTTPDERTIPEDPPEVDTAAGVADSDGFFCYELGNDTLKPDDVTSAKVSSGNGQWSVEVSTTPDGADKLSSLAEDCMNGTETCPAFGAPVGSLAVVINETVVFSAAVQDVPKDGKLEISGGFTENFAKDLAAHLNP